MVAIQVRTVPDDGAEREDWVRSIGARVDPSSPVRSTNSWRNS